MDRSASSNPISFWMRFDNSTLSNNKNTDISNPPSNNSNPNNNRNAGGSTSSNPRVKEIVKTESELSANFLLSELAYGGSDKLIHVSLGSEYEKYWKRLINSELKDQHDMRHFVNSCLVTADKKSEEVNTLITALGSPDGTKRIKEIIMFKISVDAGSQPDVASFQRVVLPFMALLTRKSIIDCTLEIFLNAIYSIVSANLVTIDFFLLSLHFHFHFIFFQLYLN